MKLIKGIPKFTSRKSGVKIPDSADESIKSLNNLPDSEKLKVLDYLNSLNNLHKEDEQ